MSRAPVASAVVLLALLLSGCGSGGAQLPAQNLNAPRARAAGGPPRHIAVIVMENEEYGDIIGSGDAPYLNRLARAGALAEQTYAEAHPSLPNYLALTGGSTGGVTEDCTGCSVPGGGLARQLGEHGMSWKAYMEDLPHPCFTGGSAGGYAKKHDPFMYYDALREDPMQCGRIVPAQQLGRDERAGTLPRLAWLTPNLCHDMHDCDVATGDRYLAATVPPLLRALGPHGLLVLTWDEGSSDSGCCRLARGGHIVTILAGGLARSGARLRTPVDHYSVLQTIEDLLNLPRLGGAACTCTPSLAALLSQPAGRASGRGTPSGAARSASASG